MSPTIKDVARLSGLSTATISKYINGGELKERNRRSVEQAIRETGYKVNLTARSLKMNRSMTIGVVMNFFTVVVFNSILSIVNDYLHEKGFSTIISETKGDDKNALNVLSLMISRQVDGIIYFNNHCDEDFLKMCEENKVPLVVVDCLFPDAEQYSCDFVLTDNEQGSYMATKHLIENGHKDIALITGFQTYYTAGQRLCGYLNCMGDYNISIRNELVHVNEYNVEGGYDAVKKMFEEKCLPTAVVICNYAMTTGAIFALNERNIEIGKEISVIAFDEIEANKAFKPQLTTINQPLYEIGRMIAQRIFEKTEGDPYSQTFMIPATLQVRDSVCRLNTK